MLMAVLLIVAFFFSFFLRSFLLLLFVAVRRKHFLHICCVVSICWCCQCMVNRYCLRKLFERKQHLWQLSCNIINTITKYISLNRICRHSYLIDEWNCFCFQSHCSFFLFFSILLILIVILIFISNENVIFPTLISFW